MNQLILVNNKLLRKRTLNILLQNYLNGYKIYKINKSNVINLIYFIIIAFQRVRHVR